MVRTYLAIAGVTAATLGLSAVMNCGGNTANATGGSASGSTTASSSSSSSGKFAEPPGPPGMIAPNGTGSVTMAISELFLGDTDPDGTPDPNNGWEHFGYNIDSVPASDLAKFCKTVDNAGPVSVHQEGLNGIENSFGHNILPLILTLASDASSKINQSIAAGTFTIMLSMEDLGTGASYNPIVTQLFGGGNLGSVPKFDGTDMWPVVPELLNNPTSIADGSKVQFKTSYLTSNTWVSGSKGTVTLSLAIEGYTISLNIANAVLSMVLSADHKTATGGIISGVIPTTQLTSQIQLVAGSIDSSLCGGQAIQSILDEIAQASDILSDGTQDPTKTCDGISIGLGFNAALVQIGPIAPPATAKTNPCATGGSGAGGSGTGGAGGSGG
jgi:hypothetical protein